MSGDLLNKRILIVEDEALIALSLEQLVSAAGGEVVGTAYSLQRALDMAKREKPIDGALIDLNLAGESGKPVADLLKQLGVPFIFLTGYGRKGLPAGYADLPVVSKPFDGPEVVSALSQAMAPAAPAEP